MTKPTFPETLYVLRDDSAFDDGEVWYVADPTVPEVDSTTPVGIYKLVETADIVVTREVKKQELKKSRS